MYLNVSLYICNIYIKCEFICYRMMDEARQAALEQKDLDALQYIQSKTGETPESAAQIAALSAQLHK